MDKGKIEAMVTKFSEKFAIIMLKKHRKFCRCGLTHLDATPIFEKSFRSFWVTLYIPSAYFWTYPKCNLVVLWATFSVVDDKYFWPHH